MAPFTRKIRRVTGIGYVPLRSRVENCYSHVTRSKTRYLRWRKRYSIFLINIFCMYGERRSIIFTWEFYLFSSPPYPCLKASMKYHWQLLRGTLFMFPDLATLSVLRCLLTFALESLTFFIITTFRTFFHLSVICVVYSDLKILSQQKNKINSWQFPCYDLLRLSTWIIKTIMHRSTYFHFWR